MPDSNILDIESNYITDSKISKIEYHSYKPYTNSFNSNDEIRIGVQQTDVYPYLHESFLYIEGKIEDVNKVKLSNNGLSFLFDQVRLEINGVEVDRTRSLGITSSVKGYLTATTNNYYCYQNAGWDLNDKSIINELGEFSACIPLKYWLGFFEDFKKVLINSRIELILTRSNNDFNSLHSKSVTTLATTGSIKLNKVVWKIPHISVDDSERLKLLKIIEKGKSLFIPFRSFETYEYPELGKSKNIVWNLKTASKLEKPRYVILGLQKNRKNNIAVDTSHFDHCKITNRKVSLNSVVYPYDNLNLNFDKKNYAVLYNMYTSFQESYYGKDEGKPILSPNSFMTQAPIVVIDTSKQNDTGSASTVDVSIEIEALDNLEGVSAHCLLIHDRVIEYVPLSREVKKLV
jgi:hypothetical protein